MSTIDECRRVPKTYVSDGMRRPSGAQVGVDAGNIKWLAFSFQSVRYGCMSVTRLIFSH